MSSPTPPPSHWTSLGKAAVPLLANTQDASAQRALIRLELAFALAEDRVGLALEPIVSAQRGLPIAYQEAQPFIKDRTGAVISNACLQEVIESESLSEALACAALRAAWGALVNNVTLRLSLRVTSRHLCASAWQSALAELTASEPDARFRLILEMTEDELLMASAELPKLQGQGITLGLVDTGSVLNLLSTTRKLPCDILRLDPEMCRGLASSPDKERLFQAKVSFAKQRDCLVVAPGLDNSQDAFAATHLGADCLAGYLYSEPDLERVPAQFG